MNLKKLEEISRIATQESSIALSKMVRGPVSVGIHAMETKKVNEIFEVMSEETLMAVVSHQLIGETRGSVALVLPKDVAFTLSDILLKKERGSTKDFSEEAKSALEELSNIVLGNYLRALSNQLGLKNLLHKAGSLSWGTAESVHEQILSSLGSLQKEGTLVAILFSFQETVVKGYVLIIFDSERLKNVGGRLRLNEKEQ